MRCLLETSLKSRKQDCRISKRNANAMYFFTLIGRAYTEESQQANCHLLRPLPGNLWINDWKTRKPRRKPKHSLTTIESSRKAGTSRWSVVISSQFMNSFVGNGLMNGPLPPAACDLPAAKLRSRYSHKVTSFTSFETATHTLISPICCWSRYENYVRNCSFGRPLVFCDPVDFFPHVPLVFSHKQKGLQRQFHWMSMTWPDFSLDFILVFLPPFCFLPPFKSVSQTS